MSITTRIGAAKYIRSVMLLTFRRYSAVSLALKAEFFTSFAQILRPLSMLCAFCSSILQPSWIAAFCSSANCLCISLAILTADALTLSAYWL